MSLENFDFASLMFYVFAVFVIGSAVMVISARNSVHSVFFLIFAFFNAAALFVLIGAEYLAMTLVIVYVGAVAVLFLFVVMMLNVNYEKLRTGFLHYLPVGLLVAVVLFVELGALIYASVISPTPRAAVANTVPDASQVTNTEAIGSLLYTHYIYLFQLSGLILLVAMIGAIVLTLRHRPDVKRQKISKQLARRRDEAVQIVKVKPGQGA